MPSVKNAQIRYRIIDRAIRNKYMPFPSKEELRQLCEENLYGSVHGAHISESTIEKDIFAMRMEHDAPIKYVKQEKGYHYTDSDYSLEKIPLSDDDIDAIKFAANIFEQFKSVEVFRKVEFAIEKILDRVNISSNLQDTAVDQFVQFETTASTSGGEHLQPLLKSIKERLIVTFNYKSYKAASTEGWKKRIVHGHILKEYRNRWYLIGYSEDKNKVITYGLDRIRDLVVSEDYFIPQKSFSADDYFKYAIGITTLDAKKPDNIEIFANTILMQYLESQPLHSSQKMKTPTSDGAVFTFELHPTPEFDMAILSYGSQVKIIKPKKYVHHIKSIVSNVLGLYK